VVREALRRVFRGAEWELATACDAATCMDAYARRRPDVVLLDHGVPGLPGLQLLEVLRERDPDATVVMLTGRAEIPIAVEAMRLGAADFLSKPIEPAQLVAAVGRAMKTTELRRLDRSHRERSRGPAAAGGAGGQPPELMRYVELLAEGTAPVLLTGETGSGKGWLARALHARSPRSAGPFVEVNCDGLSATFPDSELFGHDDGAHTDAETPTTGPFEVAQGGTLFLDEIGDLAPALQPKLLKAIESRRFRGLGGTREITVDVRLVAATHHDLRAAVSAGRFREDLYHRLAVFPLHLPPLRERGRDAILALIRQLVAELGPGRAPTTFTEAALRRLVAHPWPGNVRELRDTVERVLLVARDEREIGVEHLPVELRPPPAPKRPTAHEDDDGDPDLSLAGAELRHIARVLARLGGNRVHAARALGIARATLYSKLHLQAARESPAPRGAAPAPSRPVPGH
jgi:DNA-binding NtrC family response regulator